MAPYLWCVMLLFAIEPLCAQEQASLRFFHMTTADGLSQNSINDIYQDEWGYLWFATQDGLNRYDGYEFKVYRPDPDDEWSVSDNFVIDFVPADSGDFWLLARYGLNYFDRQTERFYKFEVNVEEFYNSPYDLFYWKNRPYVIFNWKVFALPTGRPELPRVELKPATDFPLDSVFYGCECHDKLVFKDKQGLVILDGEVVTHVPMEQADQLFRFQDFECFDDELWFAYGNLTFCYHMQTGVMDTFRLEGMPTIQDYWKRDNGELWMATQSGLFVKQTDSEWIHVPHDPGNPTGLSYPLVHCLFEDAQGTMWAGTANGGLNIFPSGSDHFRHFSASNDLLDKQVWCGFQDSRGLLWAGSETGLNLLDEDSTGARYEPLLQAMDGVRISAVAEDRFGRLWIGSSGKGLYLTNEELTKVTPIELPLKHRAAQSVSCFLPDDEGIWVGTHNLLHRYSLDGELLELVEYEGEVHLSYILSLHRSGQRLYIGTGAALHVMHLDTREIDQYVYRPGGGQQGPSFQFITDMAETPDGDIWLSTFGGGLNHFDPETKEFTFYDTKQGLGNKVLAGMVLADSALWVSNNAGIARFDLGTKTFSNYGPQDGVPFSEFSLGASGKTHDGQVFFGGTEGLVQFDPAQLDQRAFSPKPTLSDLSINYERTTTAGLIENLETLRLLPGNEVISFRFFVPDFMHADNLNYAYRMQGFDREWVDVSSAERRATYSNLPAGDYTFEVRVADQNGNWSTSQLSIPVTVIPPVWQRWWFILIASVTLLSVIVLVVRYFSQMQIKRKLREMEMQQRVHRERERISMDLHDHVGAQITYLISNLDRLGIQQPNEESNIRGLGKYAREAMRELRDTVWAIRKDSMQLGEMMQRISTFANSMFQDTRTQYQQQVSADHQLILEPAPALHLLRIIQEALHNVHKHAKADQVSLRVFSKDTELRIIISDDGQGFSEQAVNQDDHNGLRNMRDRASEIGAVFRVKSASGEGTEIEIALPVKNKANAPFPQAPKKSSLVP